jgi:putative Holliday junction resolvase
MGLDVGEKTIGIAVSDELGMTARGIEVVRRSNLIKDIARIRQLIIDNDVTMLIIGFPKNMNGSIGPQSQKVMDFGEKLRKTLNIKAVYWDERLTTVAAQRALIEADVSRKKRKKVIDKLAAVIILQSYLDSHYKTPVKPEMESE